MPRRKGEGTNGDAVPEEPISTVSSEPQLRVQMTGTADQVKRQLGVGTETPAPKPEPVIEDAEKFFALLKNGKYIVRVKRLRPKQWKGVKTAVEVWTSELPLTWEEIKSEVAENAKGGTYKVSVVDPEKSGIVDCRNFEVEGEPHVEPVEMTAEEKAMFGPQEKDAAQISIDGLNRRAEVTAKMIEVESLEHQLEEARAARVGKGKKGSSEDDGRIIDLERRLTESRHQAELEKRDRQHAEEMKELKALIAQSAKPVQSQGQSEISMLLQQMQKMQESSDKRFGDMMKQMQDDRMSQLVSKIDNLERRPARENGGMLEMAETMLKLRKVFGWGGSGDDDEGEDDENDDRPWWERALDKLGDKLTPKLIDKIFDRLDGLEKGGKSVDKDEFIKTVTAEVKQSEDEIVRIATERAIAALPKPKDPEPKPAPKVPQVNVMERKVVGEPEPARSTVPAEGRPVETKVEDPKTPLHLVKDPSEASVPTAEPMPIAKEICFRVCNVIIALERELETRPRQFTWNYDGVWNTLPESVLEKVCLAKTPAEVFDAFKVEGINVADLDKMKEKVVSTPRAAAWMSIGIRELNRWWAKMERDPDFDPADEGEEEQEEEGGGL